DHEAARHDYLVEENLTLIQRALSEFLERLAAADARQIERHEQHYAVGQPGPGIFENRQHDARAGDRAAGHPCRLLTVEDVILALAARPQRGLEAPIAVGRFGEGDVIAAVSGLGDGQTDDLIATGEELFEFGTG